MERHTYPTILTIFGGTGDLAEHKLIPALLDLYERGVLPRELRIVGFSREEHSHESYRAFVRESIDATGHTHDPELVRSLCSMISYVSGDVTDAAAYARLTEHLMALDAEIGQCANKLL